MIRLACVVEGEGELESVPVLIRRVISEIAPGQPVLVAQPPIRFPKSKMSLPGHFERYVELAANKAGLGGGILILLDADDDCPAMLGPALLRRAQKTRSDVPVAVVLANREYESWFLASAASLAGKHTLVDGLYTPPKPEAIRGAKEWLRKNMKAGHEYSPTVDQVLLTRLFDIFLARTSPSFDKLWRDLESLVSLLTNPASG